MEQEQRGERAREERRKGGGVREKGGERNRAEQTDGQTETDGQTDRRTDRRTDRQTNRLLPVYCLEIKSGSVRFGFYTSKSTPGTPPEVWKPTIRRSKITSKKKNGSKFSILFSNLEQFGVQKRFLRVKLYILAARRVSRSIWGSKNASCTKAST